MLKIKNLKIEVENKTIIEDLNLELPKNEIHVLMGPNGAGKSSICRAILNDPNYHITKGEITYNKEDLKNYRTEEIAKLGIFLLMQTPTEIPGVTNAEMLRAALVERGIKESIFEFNKRLSESCTNLGIDKEYIHHNINENMSGGEKKKNELLQIEVLKPSLIILDELDSGLDVDGLKTLSSGLLAYKEKMKASILIITHHTNILEYLHPDKVYILNGGKIVMTGDESLAYSVEKNGFKGAFSISE